MSHNLTTTRHKQEQREAAEALRREVECILDRRRSVHIKIPAELHASLRVFGFHKKLSIQEMIVELIQLIVDGDVSVNSRMDHLVKRKKEKRIKKLTKDDADNIYDYISNNNKEST